MPRKKELSLLRNISEKKDTKVKLQHNWKTKEQRNREASSVEETTFHCSQPTFSLLTQ